MQTDGQPQTPDAPSALRARDALSTERGSVMPLVHEFRGRGPFRGRRGSVIVLAVGVLAVLAIIAISYTVAVRNDRQGAQALQAASVVTGQEKVVVGEIGALATADLFGGKIVTRDIPKYLDSSGNPSEPLGSGATRIWPTMFEDGEFSDFPWVDGDPTTHSFLTSFPGQLLQGNPGAILVPNSPLAVAATHDDPWLASSEPIAGPNSTNGRWDTWPQITNLRCGYRLIPNPSNPSAKVWLRDDGRYADLGQFFLSDRALNTGKPDPDAYLSDFEDGVPNNVYSQMVSGPALGRNQQVFDFQISGMGNNPALGGLPAELYAGGGNPDPGRAFPYEPIDERFWADTDGDLRPDARWQVLDALGGLGGLRWVVACRIIDSSGQINVNTAIESGLNNTGTTFAGFSPILPIAQSGEPTITIASLLGGTTPADVDLFRLIRTADRSERDMFTAGAWFNGGMQGARDLVRVNRFDPFQGSPVRPAWRVHVDDALRLTDLLNETRIALDPNLGQERYPPIVNQPQSITGNWRYLAAERDALYREFGVAPFDNESFATPFSLDDEIELKTYWGVNNDKSLSALERSLDSGYLPAEASTYSPGLLTNGDPVISVGPLRAASPSKYERTLQPTADPGGSLARARPAVDDLRDDIRHHLTTYSGAADFSPVPVLNEAIEGTGPAMRRAYGDRAFNHKIRFRDFPTNTSGSTTAEQQLKDARKFELIRRSFEAFSWALAPLATGSNAWDRPIMPPLTPSDVGANAADAVRHYGGGPGGPATRIGTDTGVNMGAAYGILRAASLAVNLADAQDDAFPQSVTADPTIEEPTVVRLFNIAQTDPLAPPASVPDTGGGVLELGVRFSQGDVPSTSLPLEYVGQPANGVTLIGLDRQPFLRGASFLAVYENTGAFGQAQTVAPPAPAIELEINTDSPVQQRGSIFAVEVCNPWPKAVDAAGYRVALASDTGWMEFMIDSGATGGSLIPAGECATFYVSVARSSPDPEWAAAEADWEAEAVSGSGASTPRKVTDPPVMRDLTTGAPLTGTLPPVPFHTLASTSTRAATVLLITGSAAPYVVDRMTPATAGEFPALASGLVTVPEPAGLTPGQQYEGRIASAGSVRRLNDVPASGAGFPAYIIERPADNLADSYTSGVIPGGWYSWWLRGSTVAIEDLFGGATAVGYSDLKTHIGELDAASPAFPSVQFFVPNDPLRSPSELGMLCAFTHMYVHNTNVALSVIDLVRAADPTVTGEGSWRTISEQLGQDAHLAYDSAQTPGSTNINPCLGALDMTRFTLSRTAPPGGAAGLGVLGGTSGLANVPDALAVPLASRVFDCFEALDIPSGLAQGRVNVNTAPLRALRMLPWMSPWYEVRNTFDNLGNPNPAFFDGSLADASGASGFTALSRDRAFALADYREAGFDGLLPNVSQFSLTSGAADSLSREGQTHLTGLRSVGVRSGGRPSPGLVATGEMALIARWNTNASNTAAPGDVTGFAGANAYENFAEAGTVDPVGMVRRNTGMPVTVALTNSVVETDGLLDIRPNTAATAGGTTKPLDPIDDAEERLTIFRPLANIVTTRSDVFTAWFVIRGYDPRRIAAVQIPDSGDDQERVRKALNQLTPTHESRWLAVFDRSNVKSPIDRPRLLMLTQLPVK